MHHADRSPTPAQPWQALFAPLPPGVTPRRQSVASPEVLATPEGAAIAGWEQLTVELSAGPAGLRHAMVVLDANGQPISASDTVLYRLEVRRTSQVAEPRSPIENAIEFYQESVGGRIEQDGTFRGTRWHTVAVEAVEGGEPRLESTPSEPSATDVAGIMALVAELLRRQPRAKPPESHHEV
jgi:hypothetical protein